MQRARFIFRVFFSLLTIVLLVYLNTKADKNTGTILEFKFKMIEKIRKDSLDSKHKLDLLLNETTKYMDDSSQVREIIHYLTGLLGLFVTVELTFLVLEKRNYRRQETK